MGNPKEFENKFGLLPDNLEKVQENDLLNKLIKTSISKDKPILVMNKNGQKAGVITQSDLLRAVIEGNDSE